MVTANKRSTDLKNVSHTVDRYFCRYEEQAAAQCNNNSKFSPCLCHEKCTKCPFLSSSPNSSPKSSKRRPLPVFLSLSFQNIINWDFFNFVMQKVYNGWHVFLSRRLVVFHWDAMTRNSRSRLPHSRRRCQLRSEKDLKNS